MVRAAGQQAATSHAGRLRQYNTEAALLALQKQEDMGRECAAAASAACVGTGWQHLAYEYGVMRGWVVLNRVVSLALPIARLLKNCLPYNALLL